ncbi:MAG: hypothetical protein P8R54_07035 [Myxococcota bacterium]|nr:hypothetical protein [Myxococcota bacterium]
MIAHLAAALGSRTIATRQEAIAALLEAAEATTDLTAALGALGQALSDGDRTVREGAVAVLGIWSRTGGAPGDAAAGLVAALGDVRLALIATECLRGALGGPDTSEILVMLEAALGGDVVRSRGAAGLLIRGWLLAGDRRAAGLLVDARPEVRSGACEAAVSAVGEGLDGAVLIGILDGLLEDPAPDVGQHAAWLLSRLQPARLVAVLASARPAHRLGALLALASACEDGDPLQVDHAPIRACLSDPVSDIRHQAAQTFAALARTGAGLSESVSALGAALTDAAPMVQHEAVAALLGLARAGESLDGAGLPEVMATGGVRLRRTAAMAWGWHLLSHGTAHEAAALLATPDRHVRHGAAAGMSERYLRRGDVGGLLELLTHADGLIGDAVVATMRQRRTDGGGVSAGLTALHLLSQGGLVDVSRARALSAEFLRESSR